MSTVHLEHYELTSTKKRIHRVITKMYYVVSSSDLLGTVQIEHLCGLE